MLRHRIYNPVFLHNMVLNLSYHLILLITFAAGLLSGTVDAIAGGGGLISVPILLSVGVPPHVALGTNKLQAMIGICVSTWAYYRNGLISIIKIYQGLIFGFIGSILGAVSGQYLSGDFLKKIIPILLLVILLYVLFSPRLGLEENKPRIREWIFFIFFGFCLGFYDGFFGPGTGSFWIFALTFFLGYNITKATAYTKIFNLNSNLIATACFALGHNIDYRLACCMAGGQIIGSQIGVYIAIKKGAKIIRFVFIIVLSLTIYMLLH